MDSADIVNQLQQAIADLTYLSETDAPFDVVAWDQRPDDLASLIAAPPTPVETTSLESFFRSQAREHDWHTQAEQVRAKRFQSLQHLLKRHLHDIQVYKLGRTEKTVYILGKSADNSPVGLKTHVVET